MMFKVSIQMFVTDGIDPLEAWTSHVVDTKYWVSARERLAQTGDYWRAATKRCALNQ